MLLWRKNWESSLLPGSTTGILVFGPLDFLCDDVLLEFGETWVEFLGR